MTRVQSVELRRVRLPLVRPFQTSSHAKSELEHILILLRDEEGVEGWGEIASPSSPFYSAETVETCWSIASEHLVPLVLATDWEHPAELARALAKVRGNAFARAGFDIAAWVLHSRRGSQSLASVLGGVRTSVEAGVSLGIEPTIDALLQQVQQRTDDGYRRVKLKIAPGWDIDPVRAVRSAFPRTAIHVDANGAYSDHPDHYQVLEALDGEDLLMIEQPFAPRDFNAHAKAQARLETSICLDESVEEVADLTTAIALQAGRILNIKVSRMGGLTAAREVHNIAQSEGWPVWCGGMHEFGIGRAANVALASLAGFSLPSDISGSSKYYARDITTDPIVSLDGLVSVPDSPGLGWAPDIDFINAMTVDRRWFRSAHCAGSAMTTDPDRGTGS